MANLSRIARFKRTWVPAMHPDSFESNTPAAPKWRHFGMGLPLYLTTAVSVLMVAGAKTYNESATTVESFMYAGMIVSIIFTVFYYRSIIAGFASLLSGAAVGVATYTLSLMEVSEMFFPSLYVLGYATLTVVVLICVAHIASLLCRDV